MLSFYRCSLFLLFLCSMSSLTESTNLWEQIMNNRLPRTLEQAKTNRIAFEQGKSDPYNVTFTKEINFTRLTFDSLIYRNHPVLLPRRYILFNTLPAVCNGRTNLPYVVFLTGFGASPEEYGIGMPFMNELIQNGTICCFYAFIPSFFILPTGGYWYTNNGATVPELYLFAEILPLIERVMGNNVTKDPEMKILAGHSMGGFGAVMNAMRTNMQYFGSVCGLNGGLYIWNLPEFQDDITKKVLQEAITRKNGPFINCSYTQPPYRFYADDENFNTMVATSLAAVFHSDGTTTPKPNNPYFSPTLFNPDCNNYVQFFGFRYWLNTDGSVNRDMFNIAPWHSPLGFLLLNYPVLQVELSGHLYLSTTVNDTIVDYLENLLFSKELNVYNISHKFELFEGTHYDIYEGIKGCLSNFAPKVCAHPLPTQHSTEPLPLAVYIPNSYALLSLLAVVVLAIMFIIVELMPDNPRAN